MDLLHGRSVYVRRLRHCDRIYVGSCETPAISLLRNHVTCSGAHATSGSRCQSRPFSQSMATPSHFRPHTLPPTMIFLPLYSSMMQDRPTSWPAPLKDANDKRQSKHKLYAFYYYRELWSRFGLEKWANSPPPPPYAHTNLMKDKSCNAKCAWLTASIKCSLQWPDGQKIAFFPFSAPFSARHVFCYVHVHVRLVWFTRPFHLNAGTY